MAERRERDAVIAAADAEIDALFAPLARAVAASVRRHADGEAVSPLTRALALRDLDDAILPAAFGRFHGDETAPLFRLVARHSARAALAAVDRSVADVRRRLRSEPELLRLIEGGER